MGRGIEACLRRNGLENYSDLFREQQIDVDVLAELDDQPLAVFGVPWADRKRILKAIAEVVGTRQGYFRMSPLPNHTKQAVDLSRRSLQIAVIFPAVYRLLG